MKFEGPVCALFTAKKSKHASGKKKKKERNTNVDLQM